MTEGEDWIDRRSEIGEKSNPISRSSMGTGTVVERLRFPVQSGSATTCDVGGGHRAYETLLPCHWHHAQTLSLTGSVPACLHISDSKVSPPPIPFCDNLRCGGGHRAYETRHTGIMHSPITLWVVDAPTSLPTLSQISHVRIWQALAFSATILIPTNCAMNAGLEDRLTDVPPSALHQPSCTRSPEASNLATIAIFRYCRACITIKLTCFCDDYFLQG
jgi:hypothetical protein